MGRYFEEFDVGEEIISPGRTVTEADVVSFAGLSGDFNPLHTDEEYAKETMFGKRIAHGLLGLAITSGLRARTGIFDGTGLAFLGLSLSFKGAIFIGDTVKVKMKVKEKKETKNDDRGIIVMDVHLVNQKGDVVQESEHSIMVARKG
jgi:acyl dehydratase